MLAQIDSLGIWLWHRIETYRIPSALLSVTAAGLELPGPDSLQQPVRYRAPLLETPPPPVQPTDNKLLTAIREPLTVLSWNEVQAVQVSEPLTVPEDAFVLFDGETPKQVQWAPPIAGLLALFIPVSYTHLDVYKRQVSPLGRGQGGALLHCETCPSSVGWGT